MAGRKDVVECLVDLAGQIPHPLPHRAKKSKTKEQASQEEQDRNYDCTDGKTVLQNMLDARVNLFPEQTKARQGTGAGAGAGAGIASEARGKIDVCTYRSGALFNVRAIDIASRNGHAGIVDLLMHVGNSQKLDAARADTLSHSSKKRKMGDVEGATTPAPPPDCINVDANAGSGGVFAEAQKPAARRSCRIANSGGRHHTWARSST
jgi:hypothetical protein